MRSAYVGQPWAYLICEARKINIPAVRSLCSWDVGISDFTGS